MHRPFPHRPKNESFQNQKQNMPNTQKRQCKKTPQELFPFINIKDQR